MSKWEDPKRPCIHTRQIDADNRRLPCADPDCIESPERAHGLKSKDPTLQVLRDRKGNVYQRSLTQLLVEGKGIFENWAWKRRART